MAEGHKKNGITLAAATAMGTGATIGAGIFALTGRIAELAGPHVPLSFVAGAAVTALSAYICIMTPTAFPSAGGIGMFPSLRIYLTRNPVREGDRDRH